MPLFQKIGAKVRVRGWGASGLGRVASGTYVLVSVWILTSSVWRGIQHTHTRDLGTAREDGSGQTDDQTCGLIACFPLSPLN